MADEPGVVTSTIDQWLFDKKYGWVPCPKGGKSILIERDTYGGEKLGMFDKRSMSALIVGQRVVVRLCPLHHPEVDPRAISWRFAEK